MKKFYLFMVLWAMSVISYAVSDYRMSLFQKDGVITDYLVSSLDHTDYEGVDGDRKLVVIDKKDNNKGFATSSIDSITFQKVDTIKLLAIGNSFSEDAIEQELYGLFAAAGQPVIIANLYIGGCPLEKHWQMFSTDSAAYSYRKIVNGVRKVVSSTRPSTAFADEDWDYISLQEGAGHHGQIEYMEPYLTNMMNYCKKNAKNPNMTLIYHAPWAAQVGCTSTKFSYYDYDQMKMYNAIVSATKQVVIKNKFSMFMNSMDAIQNGRTTFLGDTFNRDGWHLNKTYGRYCCGCLWFEKLMGRTVVGNPYHPSSISAGVAAACQQAAHQAVVNPYKITDLSYIEAPNDTIADKGRTLARWYFNPSRTFQDGNGLTWCNQKTAGNYTYCNKPGERGYFTATGGGSGKLSYVQVDKTAWTDESGDERAGLSILDAGNGGQPVMCGQLPGDYWMFETTGNYEFEEGSVLHMSYTYMPSKYGAQYWLLEYLDGDTWKPAFETKETKISLSGETITYNISLTADTRENIDFKCVLENRTKEFKVRMKCCSEYQVNGKWFAHPRRQSVQRIAGTPEDNNLPIMEELFNASGSKKHK